MEIKKDFNPTCFFCNTELRIDLDGIMITALGGYANEGEGKHEEKKTEQSADEMVEVVNAKLCTCPLCGRKERIIGEDPFWLKFTDMFAQIKQGKLVSTNPEIEFIFKLMEKKANE